MKARPFRLWVSSWERAARRLSLSWIDFRILGIPEVSRSVLDWSTAVMSTSAMAADLYGEFLMGLIFIRKRSAVDNPRFTLATLQLTAAKSSI